MIRRSQNHIDVDDQDHQAVAPAAVAVDDDPVDDDPIDDGFNPYGSGPVPIVLREDEGV